jgi:Uma2 family endonuclease
MATFLVPQTNELTYIPSHLWRLSVDRYHEMMKAGVLTEDDHLELLEGYLIEKMTINPPHSFVTGILRELLGQIVPESHFVNSQQPITTTDSEPEPDILIVQGQRRDFLSHHPAPAEVLLVIEVSDATLHQDRSLKKRIYARAGIAVYWIVNLPEAQIEVYTEPSGSTPDPTYHQLMTYHKGDAVPVVVDGVEIGRLPVNDLLP